jgi:hypothetical protein
MHVPHLIVMIPMIEIHGDDVTMIVEIGKVVEVEKAADISLE